MQRWDTVAIVGVGLIGGSIGLALRRGSLARRVIGVGRHEARLRHALDLQALTEFSTDLARGVASAELIVVCTPVAQIVPSVQAATRVCPAGALITDAGSVKAAICRDLDDPGHGRGVFVGSHPLAGSERSGVEFATADLFSGRLTIVTPTAAARPEAVAQVEQFWVALGSRVTRMTPDAHDRALAAVSHVPHMVAAALAAATPPEYLQLVATGWHDTTRVASGAAELWQEILTANRAYVLQSLADFEKVLSDFRRALATADTSQLGRLLQAGKDHRDSVGN
jgi:prephenate dehydrogenase